MPLTYATAPMVVDNQGRSGVPLLAQMANGVKRSTPVARFASAFRSCRRPLAGEVGAQVVSTYQQFRNGVGKIAVRYDEAMPCSPPRIEQNRAARYEWIRSQRTIPPVSATINQNSCGKKC
jgi:hypothetical protein